MQRYIFNETVYLGQDARFCLKDELKNRGFKRGNGVNRNS